MSKLAALAALLPFSLSVGCASTSSAMDGAGSGSNPAGPGTGGYPQAGAGGNAQAGAGTSGSHSAAGSGGATAGASGGGTAGTSGGGAAGTSGGGAAGAANGGTAGATSGNPPVAAGVRWVGRVDVSDPAAIKLAWSNSGFVGSFTGAVVSAKLKTVGDGDIFFQPVVDGTPGKRFSVNATEQVVDIATGLSAGPHRVELYRETEGKGFGYSAFLGFTQGTPAAPPAASGRLIEIVGDSISAGYGNLGTEQHPGYAQDPSGGCPFTTATESAYQAYGPAAARAVNADASVLAGSGWGIYSDNLGDSQNVMPLLFGNTLGEQKTPAWGFVAQPQAVIINLGTNDATAKNLTEAKFKPAYAAFLDTVRKKYPAALVLCAVGSMLSGADRDNAIKYINALVTERAAQGDTKVKLLDLGTEDALKGTGCAWHPNVAEDQRMAALLAAELKSSLGW